MIGKIIYSFIVFVIAVCIGLWLKAEPGYVLIAYGHWTVESTLWFVVVALAIFCYSALSDEDYWWDMGSAQSIASLAKTAYE